MTALATHTLLTPPRFARVPGQFTFRRDALKPRLARFARILLELGVITNADAPQNLVRMSESALVEKALRRWSAGVTGRELTALGHVYHVINPDSAAECHASYQYTGNDAPNVDPDECVMVALVPWDSPQEWIMEARADEIERRVPGLGETALHLLEIGLWRSAVGFMPRYAGEVAEEQLYGWWEEAGENEPPVKQQDFEAAIPAWARDPKLKLRRPALETLRRREPLARALLDLLDLIQDKRPLRPDVGGYYHVLYSVVMRWSLGDHVMQIHDDYCEGMQNGGECTNDFGWFFVPLEPKAVERFLDGYARLLKTLEACDRVIPLIADRLRPL